MGWVYGDKDFGREQLDLVSWGRRVVGLVVIGQ